MPEISVIVPVYRAEDFLTKCVDSILNQSFSDLELLLIDDGSPDSSGALCDEYAAKDARVRVFHKENEGVSVARNLGMKEATGRFIAFADSDDWLPENALESLYRACIDQEADSAGGAHYRVEVSGQLALEKAALPPGVYGPEEIHSGIVHRLLGDRMGDPETLLNGFIWRFLFTRSIIIDHNIHFAGAYLEDEIFLMEYFCYVQRLAIVDQSVYYYLQNPVSVTRNYLPDYMETFTTFMQAKEALVAKFHLADARPLWRENSNWSGLLIAIGNEFAPGNTASLKEKRRKVREMTQRPDMAQAIQTLRPKGLGRNKQLVVNLVRSKQFFLLSLLYALKNRGN